MSVTIMTPSGEKEVPTRGGGINLELLARLQSLENEVSGLRQELTQVQQSRGGEDYGLVKLTSSSTVTDSTGLALPASENNPAVPGSLANRINTEFVVRWQSLGSKTVGASKVFSFQATADSVSGYKPFGVAGLNMNWPTCVATDFSVNSSSPYNIAIGGINVGEDTPSFTPYIGIIYKKD